jgi:hypothetical protein
MIIKFLTKLLLAITVISLPATAQTSDELRHKYKVSSIVESYEIRSGIIATVFFGEDNQAVSISIKPRLFYLDTSSKYAMPLAVAQEILTELVPIEKRGKLCADSGFESGRNYYRTILYENVQIDMAEHDRDTPKDNVSQINVLWQEVSCPYAPPNNSLQRTRRSALPLSKVEHAARR